METGAKIGGAIVVLVIIVAITMYSTANHKSQIQDWANDNSCVVKTIDKAHFSKGPFWIRDEHHTIYQVKVSDHLERDREVWFRFGSWLGPSVEWYDEYADKE